MNSVTSLEVRRAAIAAALRDLRDSSPTAAPPLAAAYPADPRASEPQPSQPDPLVARLGDTVARLTERLERLEVKIELMQDGDDAPLVWPVAVGGDSTLDVPPLEVARRNSPAFDVLMGPPSR